MSGQTFIRSNLVIFIWIYAVFAAPVAEENHVMENNMTGASCFKDVLPQELKLHHDICLGNNIGGDNILKESEVLSCILKTAGVISEEGVIDTSKLKIQATEEEASDMKMIEDDSPFTMSVETCETSENSETAQDFVHCLYEMLAMNCTEVMSSDEETDPEQGAEEN